MKTKIELPRFMELSAITQAVIDAAAESVDTGAPLPADFADLFTLEVRTREDGTRYGVLSWA